MEKKTTVSSVSIFKSHNSMNADEFGGNTEICVINLDSKRSYSIVSKKYQLH